MSTPEDLYKDKFSGYTPQPPQELWTGINRRIARRNFLKFSPRTFNIYYMAAACALAVAGYSQLKTDTSDTITIPAPYVSQAQLPNPQEHEYAGGVQLKAKNTERPGTGNTLQLKNTEPAETEADTDTALSAGTIQIAETAPIPDSAPHTPAAAVPAAAQTSAPEPRQNSQARPSAEITCAARGLTAVMEARTQGAQLSYTWDMGDGSRAVGKRVQHRYKQPGTYRIRLVAFSGTAMIHDTVYQEIRIKGNEYQLKFPNALVASTSEAGFAPRGNVAEVSRYRLAVYSRNGAEVFSTTNPYEGWNGYYKGERLPKGVYAYRASYEFANGEQSTDNGSITLFWEENTNLTIHR